MDQIQTTHLLVLKAKSISGSTQTGLALKYAIERVFAWSREGAARVVIVLSDGRSQDEVRHKTLYCVYVFGYIFILLSRESNQSPMTRSFKRYRRSVYRSSKMGNPAKCLFQQHNQYTCMLVLHTVLVMLSVKQGSCEYQFCSHWFALTRNQTGVRCTNGRRFYHSVI